MTKRMMYPFLNLKEAIDRVTELRQKLGGGPYKQEAILDALGYKGLSGASTRAVASLSHYGLLSKTANGYAVSELAIKIVRPMDEPSKERAIKQAASTPKLFADLIDIYADEQLPTMLENYLIHNFQMTDQAAKKVSNVFKKTMKFAGLIDESGYVRRGDTRPVDELSSQNDQLSVVDNSSTEDIQNIDEQNSFSNTDTNKDTQLIRNEILLSTGKAALVTPSNMTSEDKDKLRKLLDIL